jgi:YD repeat-containing protein
VWSSQPVSASRFTYHSDGLLRHVVGPQQWRQMTVNPGTAPDPATASAEDLNEYAATEYEYTDGRLTKMYKNGRSYSYDISYAQNSPGTLSLNAWTRITQLVLANGAVREYYYNRIGQLMLSRVAESASSGAQVWNRLYQWFEEDSGRLLRSAGADAISAVDESSAGLVTLHASEGQLTDYSYNGNGRREAMVFRKGSAGSAVPQRTTTYEARSTSQGIVYYPASEVRYRNTDGTGSITTSYQYDDWYADSFQYRYRTTVAPIVPTSENGSGVAGTTVEEYNSRGYLVSSTDEDGTVTSYTYDEAKGGMTSMTRDAGIGRLNLRTDYTLDDLGRRIKTLNPVHEIDLGGTPTEIRTASWVYYKDALAEQWSFAGYQSAVGVQLVGPVSISRACASPPAGYPGWGRAENIDAACAHDFVGIPGPDATFAQDTWLRWRLSLTDQFSQTREQRSYFAIPSTEGSFGTEDLNYGRSLIGYDEVGRANLITDADDTIDKTIFNAVGWPITQQVATLTSSGPSAFTTVQKREYADNGNLTKLTAPVSSHAASDRITEYAYDWRNRLEILTTTAEKETSGYWTLLSVSTYDNLNQVIASSDYHTSYNSASPTTNRTGYRTMSYDTLGRTWKTEVYAVNASGVASLPQTSLTWFTRTGQVARSAPAGSDQFTASVFDDVGRTIKTYAAYFPASSSSSSSSSSTYDPADVSEAVVMEQQEMTWDAAGNMIATTVRQRLDSVSDTTLGELTTATSRTSYVASYPDPLGRTIATAAYGTNGSLNGSGGWTRPLTVPSRSDDILVQSTLYDTAGNAATQIAADATITNLTFDAADRLTQTIENAMGGSGETRTTRYEHTPAGLQKKLLSDNPNTGTQVTEWIYGVTTGQGSALNSNRLLRKKATPMAIAPRSAYPTPTTVKARP